MDKKLLFLQWLEDAQLSPYTIKDYSYMARRFPEHLEQVDVDIYCNKNKRTIDRATIKNYIEFIIQKFPELKPHYIDLRVPKVRGRQHRKIPVCPTEEDVLKIIPHFENDRGRIITLIQFYCALRPQGVLNLKKENFFIDEWLQNPDKPCKIKVQETKSGERIVFLKKEIIEKIKDKLINAKVGANLFPIAYRRWHYLLTTASKKALGYPISPHQLRHGGATWLLNKKGFTLQEVSDFLGHKSIATTQIYAHLDKEKMMEKYG